MTELFLYFIKVSIIQLILISLYYLFLKKETVFSINRFYLIGSLVLGFLIPIIDVGELSINSSDPTYLKVVEMIAVPKDTIAQYQTSTAIPSIKPILDYVEVVYILIVCSLFIRYVVNIFKLINHNKHNEIKKAPYKIFKTSMPQAFSFFDRIYLPDSILKSSNLDMIVKHECEHVRRWHSMDRIFIDLVILFFWFNPFIYLYRKAIIEVHEYEADAAVINSERNKAPYLTLLLSQSFTPIQMPVVSQFQSLTIKRIMMITKIKSSKKHVSKLILIIPVIACMSLVSSFNSISIVNEITNTSEVKKTKEIVVMSPQAVEKKSKEKPSIFPVSRKGDFRVSSHYGKRKDPFTKEMKYHRGIDIAAPEGTDVIATGDGVVELVEFQKGGYGKRIIVDHGNGFKSLYAQLSDYAIAKGDQVTKGQVIGKVGSSGRSTAPHLHYEVMENGSKVNPVGYILDYTFKQK